MKKAVERLSDGKPVRDASATLAEVVKDWRTKTLVASSRKETTKELYAGLLKSHVESSPVALKRLDRFRASDVDSLIVEMRGRTKSVDGVQVRALSESTIEKVIRVLRLALDGAVRDQLLARNPWMPRSASRSHVPRFRTCPQRRLPRYSRRRPGPGICRS